MWQEQKSVSIDAWKALDALPPEVAAELRSTLKKPMRMLGTQLGAVDLADPDNALLINEGSPDGITPVRDIVDRDGFVIRFRAPVVVLDPEDAALVRDAIERAKLDRCHLTMNPGPVENWTIRSVVRGLGAKVFTERTYEDGSSIPTLQLSGACINLIGSATSAKDSDLLIPAMWAWAEQQRAIQAGETSAIREVDRHGEVVDHFVNANVLVQKIRKSMRHAANVRGESATVYENKWRKLADESAKEAEAAQ
jgi:hypothetical protein